MDISPLYTQRLGAAVPQQTNKNDGVTKFADFITEAKSAEAATDLQGPSKAKLDSLEAKFAEMIRGRRELKAYPAKISTTKPEPDLKYQQYIDQMMHKANQSANQMSDDGRARVSAEFEELSEKLIDHLEKSGMFHDNVMPIVKNYIRSLDISDKTAANDTFNEMYNLNTYVDRMDGTYEAPRTMDAPFGETMEELMQMANQSAGHMTAEARAQLAEKFDKTMNQFLDELDESGLIEYDVVMNFMRDYMGHFDISDQEGANRAFNEMYNMKNYLGSLMSA